MRALVGAILSVFTLALSGCGGGEAEPGKGDPESGAAVFAAQGCGNCHTLAAAKSNRNTGPNLDLVAKRYDTDFIRTSILDPEAFVEKGSGGKIGGDTSYPAIMTAYGPDAENEENRITDQEVADLVAYVAGASGK
jgi:mono/diheme cytochrome c family protein